VAEFLSPEWITEMERAAAATLDGEAATVSLAIRQVVTGPDGAALGDYVIRLEGGRLAVTAGPGAGSDVTFTADLDTAVALARGELDPQTAFMSGRVRVGGEVGRLLAAREALAALGDLFASVRAATSYQTLT